MSPSPSFANQLRPCLAELLRTRYHSRCLIFRIEEIIEETRELDANHEGARQLTTPRSFVAYRLLLSDGELMINATVKNVLHRLITSGSVEKGSLIVVSKYELRRSKRLNGKGSVLYVDIEDFQTVSNYAVSNHHGEKVELRGGNPKMEPESIVDASEAFVDKEESLPEPDEPSFCSAATDGILPSDAVQKDKMKTKNSSASPEERTSKRRKMETAPMDVHNEVLREWSPSPLSRITVGNAQAKTESDQDDSDDFETITRDSSLVHKRRQALSQLSGNTRLSATDNSGPNSTASTSTPPNLKRPRGILLQGPRPRYPEYAPNSQHLPSRDEQEPQGAIEHQMALLSAPVHTLLSLLQPSPPLPQKTYRCAVFGLVSWVSPSILKKFSFPPKRHIKVHDQSISHRYSGISISIFHDAQNFVPKVGTVALFSGLTAQWWEKEVILNAYERDCQNEDWVIWDENLLRSKGFDVGGLRGWWEERKRRRAGK